MIWRKKRFEYEIAIPPLKKPIDQLSKTEAQAYFDWYMGILDERIRYLQRMSKIELDFSSDSFLSLWRWFLKNAEVEDTPKEVLKQLEEDYANHPLKNHILAGSTKRLSVQTEYMIRDIGMYLGEAFVDNYPSIYWGFYTKPKRDFFVNRPLLLGFPNEIFPEKKGPPFEPIHMVSVQAAKLCSKNALSDDLFCIYTRWSKKIR